MKTNIRDEIYSWRRAQRGFMISRVVNIAVALNVEITVEQAELIDALVDEWHGTPEDLLEIALELS